MKSRLEWVTDPVKTPCPKWVPRCFFCVLLVDVWIFLFTAQKLTRWLCKPWTELVGAADCACSVCPSPPPICSSQMSMLTQYVNLIFYCYFWFNSAGGACCIAVECWLLCSSVAWQGRAGAPAARSNLDFSQLSCSGKFLLAPWCLPGLSSRTSPASQERDCTMNHQTLGRMVLSTLWWLRNLSM